jgi:hypothetical protein
MSKLITLCLLATLPLSVSASGGFASIGKDLHCVLELSSDVKPFPCDLPGGICAGKEASTVVIFRVLKGDLAAGLSGTVGMKSFLEGTGSSAEQSELQQIARELAPTVDVAYKDQSLFMRFNTTAGSSEQTQSVDLSAGRKFAHEVLVVNGIAQTSEGLTVDATLTCAAGTTNDR